MASLTASSICGSWERVLVRARVENERVREVYKRKGRKEEGRGTKKRAVFYSSPTGSGKVGLKMGHPKSQAASRAIGPKTVHAERTLVFLPPDKYKGSGTRRLPPQQQQPPRVPSLQPQRSNVHIQALNFEVMEPRRIRGGLATSSRVQYHTLAGSVSRHGGQQQTRQNMSAGSVLPMEVINSPRTNQLTAAIAS